MKKNVMYIGLLSLFFMACDNKAPVFDAITAEPMPSILASGEKFPTDSTKLNGWIDNSVIVNNLETNKDIITHGWDIWDALTQETDQQNNGQALRRFETWYTPSDIQKSIREKAKNSDYKLSDIKRGHQGHLEKPHQHSHGLNVESSDVVAFVKYDPTAAEHIYDKDLYVFEKLQKMIKTNEISNIPAFPASSVAIKPVFYPLTDVDANSDGTYNLDVWPGYDSDKYPMEKVIDSGFGPSKWKTSIKITLDGKTDKSKNIFSINEFIHFKLNEEQAGQIVNVIDNGKAKAGDHVVLVAMHVNTRENQRWTWQTFWWSKTPSTPFSPSSELIASLRPSSLDNAAGNYAMGVAYNMISPSQKYYDGSNHVTKDEPVKESIYAYNPYLEAGFNAATFDVSPQPYTKKERNQSGGNDSIRKYYSEGYQKVGATLNKDGSYSGGKLNRVGIETNCMSCHGQARIYKVDSIGGAFQYYVTDQYFDLNAPYFKSTIVLDFVWSIQGSLINDPTKTSDK